MSLKNFLSRVDWMLLLFTVPITLVGLLTMQSYGQGSPFFAKQIIWIAVSIVVFIGASFIDVSILKKTKVLIGLFLFFNFLLLGMQPMEHVVGLTSERFHLSRLIL